MGLFQELDDRLKSAMRSKNERELKVIRMVRTRLKNHIREAKVEGELPDAEVRRIVGAYVKQLKKSVPEFEKGGEAARDAIEQIRFEIDYLEPFAPQLLDEAQTRALVERVVAEMGKPPVQKSGMVMGRIMKAHGDEVDAQLVRRLVDEALSG